MALLVAAAAALPLAAASAALGKDYPGAWRDDANAPIVRTLAKNGIKGCGDFSFRVHASQPGEFLVYCTLDGKTWTAWLAWTATQQVMGPYPPDPGMALPVR